VKVREGISATDYSDPGWYEHPEGTVAYEWTGETPIPASSSGAKTMAPATQHGGHGKQG
jgi:manganese oxidase